MWPFRKKKIVVVIVTDSNALYLNEDLSYGKDIESALRFSTFSDAHSVAIRLRRFGADAATAEVVYE